MKKIVINGGDFYKAFLVASKQNVSLNANEFLTLVNNPKSDTIYLFEVTRTPESDIEIHNGAYIVYNKERDFESPARYTARVNNPANPIMIKSMGYAITISVDVYEIKEFVPVKCYIPGTNAYDFINDLEASSFQFPIFQSGKKYEVKLTPLYSGKVAYYQGGLQYQNDNAVENETYVFQYTATSADNPYLRDWVGGHQLYVEINEVL
jgi:hypothetical protein